LRQLLDRATQAWIGDVGGRRLVSRKGVENERPRTSQDGIGVAQREQCADTPAFMAGLGDVDGQVQRRRQDLTRAPRSPRAG
jgi:hypothetical protein